MAANITAQLISLWGWVAMQHTAQSIGVMVRKTRKAQGLTQAHLAMVCGTGLRFIGDLERGKTTCEWSKVLMVIQTLGIVMHFTLPPLEDIR